MVDWTQFKAIWRIRITKFLKSKFIEGILENGLYALVFQLPFIIYTGMMSWKTYLLGLALYLMWNEIVADIGDALSRINKRG